VLGALFRFGSGFVNQLTGTVVWLDEGAVKKVSRQSVALAIVMFGFARLALSQSAPPVFEVATVRASGPDSAEMSLQRQPGGRLVTSNTPLTFLINWAHSLDDGRLFGAPRGADSARFDIVAKAPTDNPGPGQMQLMLRSLLAERFGLITHIEKRNRNAYTLMVAEGGPKVSLANPPETPEANPFSMSTPGVLKGRHVTADMLVKALSGQLGEPVENLTRLTGSFDFTLQWRPDASGVADDGTRASLFTAIQEQLGLRLDARRVPIEVIVIDRLSLTPTPN
jgi:uncharacterized protein (TIGR03435 family)